MEVRNFKSILISLNQFKGIVNTFIFDSPSSLLPGGNGKQFNWKILNGNKIYHDWLLAGGLNTNNIFKAIKLTNPKGVDISSGLEEIKGKKSPQLIENFVRKCRNIR